MGALVRKARSGRPVLALDGCPLVCVRACLEQAEVEPTEHLVLSELGVRKHVNADFDPDEAEELWPRVRALAERLAALAPE